MNATEIVTKLTVDGFTTGRLDGEVAVERLERHQARAARFGALGRRLNSSHGRRPWRGPGDDELDGVEQANPNPKFLPKQKNPFGTTYADHGDAADSAAPAHGSPGFSLGDGRDGIPAELLVAARREESK